VITAADIKRIRLELAPCEPGPEQMEAFADTRYVCDLCLKKSGNPAKLCFPRKVEE
jgi:hypothetical protein